MLNWDAEFIDHFTLAEARCHERNPDKPPHDCGLVILVPELLECQYKVRYRFGRPIIALSWTRCPPHNAAVGGVRDSLHVNGRALDERPEDMADLGELEQIAREEYPFVLRRYWGLHCDIRGERPMIIGGE